MIIKPSFGALLPWGTALLLGVVATALPRLLKLNEHLGQTGFFTPEAYGMGVGLLLMGMIVAAVNTHSAVQRATIVGLGPMLVSLWRMVFEGPGNLWPIVLAIALVLGLPPALAGAGMVRAARHFLA